jgi:hypothetical protein
MFIQTARHVYGLGTLDELRTRHEQMLRARAQATRDSRVKPFPAGRPLVARVNDGAWIGDCDCNAGVAVDPEWSEARCFGCGAVYTEIVFPERRAEIETLLEARPRKHQNWDADEPIEIVRDLNLRHGLEG